MTSAESTMDVQEIVTKILFSLVQPAKPSRDNSYGVPEEILTLATPFLKPSSYMDVVEERTALHICGYPTCKQLLPHVTKKYKKPQYRINISKRTVRLLFFC